MANIPRPRVAVWREVWLADSETFVRDQVRAMQRWDPFLVGLRRRPNVLGVEADLAPLATTRLTEARTQYLGTLGLRGRLVAGLREAGVDLVHAHFGTSATHALPVARAAGLPLVVTFHGYDVTRTPTLRFPFGAEYRRRLAGVFDYASRLVAVSDFIAGELVRLGAPEHKIVVRHIGIAIDDGAPAHLSPDDGASSLTPDDGASSAGQGPVDARRGVVFVGRLVAKKGVDHLLEAVALLPGEVRAEHPLVVIGDGPLRAGLESRARELGVDARFLGHLPPEEVRRRFAAARVLGAPSRTAHDGDAEGFGMVFLEAAAQGTPAVAYRHGGVVEAVVDGRTGLLSDEGDVAGLTENLRRLLTDPGLARSLGEAGRARVLADFDIRRCTARLEDLYDEVRAER